MNIALSKTEDAGLNLCLLGIILSTFSLSVADFTPVLPTKGEVYIPFKTKVLCEAV